MTKLTDNSIEQRVETLLNQLTLKEKVSLLSGEDDWHTVAIPRLGIPALVMTDGPHGVRANRTGGKRIHSAATSFPTGVSMAASWDPTLIERVAEALAEETRALGCDILLGPCVNIVRTPLAGRNFESYAEDPYLAGRIGVAWVNGLQRKGVGASLKHYACNNQEFERHRGSSVVDERTLREIYLAQFEMVVKEANPWTVMCSYNRINGVYASENDYLLNQILKGEWGFEGVVVSDWGANHTTVESVAGGLDLEMPGPALYYGRLLEAAVHTWQVNEDTIDEAARRMLRMIVKSGKMDGPLPAGSLNTPEHQALARELAEASITLLKNDGGVLPLKGAQSIAVIGPNAAECRIGGGGSSYLEPPYRVSPLEGLKAKLGDAVVLNYEQGCDNFVELPAIKPDYLGEGLLCEFFNNADLSGAPVASRIEPNVEDWRIPLPPGVDGKVFSARWTGTLTVPSSGRYALQLRNASIARLYLDGNLVMEATPGTESGWLTSTAHTFVTLEAERAYALKVEYVKLPGVDSTALYLQGAFAPDPDDRLERAVALARQSDVAIIFGGMPKGFESEGRDRPDMKLPGEQDALIAAVAAANPNTVVVLNVGSPVEMPWAADVAAIVLAYYMGQEGGHAVANVLTGAVNPSGKLPVTFPKRYEDNPTFINYPGSMEVLYGEGIFVGYRYYDKKDVEPLFPFGHGLSYTTFAYSDAQAPETVKAGEPVRVAVTLTNTGAVAGQEVVQVYVGDPVSSLVRPPKELKGFKKVHLEPGQSAVVEFTLDERALSFYDPYRGQWVAEPGAFTVAFGSSSRDIRAQASFTLA
ncbi:MAG TPA: glycoside hydrolase family 3 C-terminal domain-containing protein [Anaerolineae bacterium]|nr:glycoside hydrolase family 3 C-terminal domain-containing protein [Anaerolineae bacterium]HQI85319.1 glycoside hydrolase family 3 C-terminal domain-containing protein [Anaerolineae bacterium]